MNDLKNLPKYTVLRCLLCESLSVTEVMRSYDIFSHDVPLSGEVAAFVYYSRKARYHIFINDSLSPEARNEVSFHELYHIIEDMPKAGYILGIDGQRSSMEKRADNFFREVAAAMAVK